ncbi:MAG: site-2 protease family protein [Planctomyces sp.]|jgi:Zn-dependent protease
MFGPAGSTEFDVRFELFGIPVRIHPLFWLTSAMIVWDGDSPPFVFLGVFCVFLSVLVHELGHAVVSRRYGFPSEIVLYMFGGYATGGGRLSTWQRIAVSGAGPLAGILLFAVALFISHLIGRTQPELFRRYEALYYCLYWLVRANLFWSLLNLVPCLPLDGGHIMQALVYRFLPIGAPRRVLQISIAVSGGVVLLLLLYAPWLQTLMIMFGILCAQSVMAYRQFHY